MQFIINIFKKEPKEKGKGLVDEPIDYRDITYESIFKEEVEIPEEYNVPYKMNIKNQGNTPHCVGYSCATIKEFLEKKEQNDIEFDGDWIYKECKKIDNYDGRGTYFRAGLSVLKNTGAKPIGGSEADVSAYRIGGYIKIGIGFKELKKAIYQFGAVVLGFQGSNAGWQNAYIRPPKSGENTWGHAVSLAVGYNKNYIFLQNSWGTNKGDKGYYYFDKNYLPISAYAVLVDLPNNWKELLTNEEDKLKHYFAKDLYFGMKNDEVKVLQNCLKWLGCMPKEIDSTGYFGNITLAAVKLFQQRYSIYPVAGYCGQLTRIKLNELFYY